MHIYKLVLLSLSYILLFGCAHSQNERISSGTIEFNHGTRIENSLGQDEPDYQEIIQEAETDNVLNLKEALALTLIHNPELKVYSLEIRAAEARQLQNSLMPNPEIEIEVEEFGGSSNRSEFEAAETSVQLSQTIELGGKLQKREKVAFLDTELTKLDYQITKLEVFSETIKAFLNVLKAQEKLELSNELLNIAVESFESVEKRVDAGKDSPLEKTRASIALSNIKSENQQAHLELEYSMKKLASFWAQDDLVYKIIEGNLGVVEEMKTFEDFSNQLKRNPEYKLWKLEVEKSQAKLSLEKSKSIGDMTVGAGVQKFHESDDNAFVFGFSVPLPVYDRNQGAKEEALVNLIQKKEKQKAAIIKLQNSFNEAYKEFTKSHNKAVSMKNEVLPAASELLESSTTAYNEGKIDYLNLLDAQRTFFDVQNEYIESLVDYHIAKTDIERLINNQSITIEK